MSWRTLAALALALVSAAGVAFLHQGDLPRPEYALQAPSLRFPAGTDELGRNVLARTTRAASLSLVSAILAWGLALVLGLMLGGVAGLRPRSWIGRMISTFIAFAYSVPFFLLLVGVLAVTGGGLLQTYLALVAFAWVSPARYTQAVVDRTAKSAFVLNGRALGLTTRSLLRYTVVPEVLPPVVIASAAMLPEIVALDAALSFFGLGAPPPMPTLGKMIVDGIAYLQVGWWLAVVPVGFLLTMCLGLRNFISPTLTDHGAIATQRRSE